MAEEQDTGAPAEGGGKKAKQKKSGSKLFTPLLIIFSLAAIVFIQMTYIFLIIGMLPSIVAYIVDKRPGKMAFQAVACFNLAGMLHYLAELVFIQGNDPGAVQQMMQDGTVWLTIFTSAAMGWVMIFALPYLMNTILAGINSGQVMRLESMQKKLEDKWGDDIRRG